MVGNFLPRQIVGIHYSGVSGNEVEASTASGHGSRGSPRPIQVVMNMEMSVSSSACKCLLTFSQCQGR